MLDLRIFIEHCTLQWQMNNNSEWWEKTLQEMQFLDGFNNYIVKLTGGCELECDWQDNYRPPVTKTRTSIYKCVHMFLNL